MSLPTDGLNMEITPSPTLAATSRGDLEKVLAMLVLGLGSLLSGLLPAFISERNRRRFPLTTSLLLCFGAGAAFALQLRLFLRILLVHRTFNFVVTS